MCIRDRHNNTVKGSPTKYLPKKQDMTHVSQQSSSNQKNPSHEETRKQRHTKNSEIKHNQYHSTNPSNNTSLVSSREQTPKAPNSSKQSPQEARQEQGLNLEEQKTRSTDSRIITGKHITWYLPLYNLSK